MYVPNFFFGASHKFDFSITKKIFVKKINNFIDSNIHVDFSKTKIH